LILLVKQGRVFDVMKWFEQGLSAQAELPADEGYPPRYQSALEFALATGQHSMVQVLLSADDYRVNPDEYGRLFTTALKDRRSDVLDLLFEHGVDPRAVDLETVFSAPSEGWFERFYTLGVDFCQEDALAKYLGQTGNKSLLGWLKKKAPEDPRLQEQLDRGMQESSGYGGSERRAALCLWAGADPRANTPEYGSPEDGYHEYECKNSLELAVYSDYVGVVRAIGPNPDQDHFDRLYRHVSTKRMLNLLASIQPPRNLTECIKGMLGSFEMICEVIKTAGEPWSMPADKQQLATIRRDLLGRIRPSRAEHYYWADRRDTTLGRSSISFSSCRMRHIAIRKSCTS
jgi:hypothetical protein